MNPIAIALLVMFVLAAPVRAESPRPAPANSLRELFHALGRCLSSAGTAPGEITLVFSLRRDGGLIGKPHIAYSKLPRGSEAQKRFIDGVAAAFDRCIPIEITDALGGAIAGRPLSMRIGFKGKDTDI